MRIKQLWIYLLPLAGVAAALAGWFLAFSDSGQQRTPHRPEGLLLLCDQSLEYPIESPEMEHDSGAVGRFMRRRGVRVTIEYGSASELLDQLIINRIGDLFLAAGPNYLTRAEEAGLVHDTRKVAQLVPVILVRRGNPLGIGGVEDLADPELRLAVADDRASLLGRISTEVFQKNGVPLYDLENINFIGEEATEVAAAVQRGRSDAALTWRPVAKRYGRNTEIVDIPPDLNLPQDLVIAVLETASDKEKASGFADFLSSPSGQGIFEMYGFDI